MCPQQRDPATVDWRAKGFWWPDQPVPDSAYAAAGHHLFGGAVTWPVLVARRDDHTIVDVLRTYF